MFTENCVLSHAMAEKMSQEHRARQKQWNALSWLVYSSSPRPATPSDSRPLYNHFPTCVLLPSPSDCVLSPALLAEDVMKPWSIMLGSGTHFLQVQLRLPLSLPNHL